MKERQIIWIAKIRPPDEIRSTKILLTKTTFLRSSINPQMTAIMTSLYKAQIMFKSIQIINSWEWVFNMSNCKYKNKICLVILKRIFSMLFELNCSRHLKQFTEPGWAEQVQKELCFSLRRRIFLQLFSREEDIYIPIWVHSHRVGETGSSLGWATVDWRNARKEGDRGLMQSGCWGPHGCERINWYIVSIINVSREAWMVIGCWIRTKIWKVIIT